MLPILPAADPLTVPAKIYDRIWVEEIVIDAPDPNGAVNARVRLRRYTLLADGTAELEPEPGRWVQVNDVLTGAQADAELAAVVTALMTYVAKVGVESGIVGA